MAKVKLKKGTQEEFKARVEAYIHEDIKILTKARLRKTPIISFPKKTKVPFMSRLALKIIRSQGGIFDTRYHDGVNSI